jgi:hypothetical protein
LRKLEIASGIGEEGVETVKKLEIASGGAGIGEEGTGIDILIVSNTRDGEMFVLCFENLD